VKLDGQATPGADAEDFAGVLVGVGKPQLAPPGLGYLTRKTLLHLVIFSAIASAVSSAHYLLLMDFAHSYLGQLRKRIGTDLVLMPGAMIALRRPTDGRVLFTSRADDGTWCLPAGAAEAGGSFAATAIDELEEETGLTVDEVDLVPFATLSRADLHTIIYPSGDETHCFAICFLAER
jgi:hypothetical protein